CPLPPRHGSGIRTLCGDALRLHTPAREEARDDSLRRHGPGPAADDRGPRQGAPPVIKAIVFDFDGVILDNADVKTEAFVELYAGHGSDIAAKVREHHLANLGISRFKKFEWIATNLLRTSITEQESQALGKKFSDLAL